MSLILEALRKSEAERRRAQVPDLLTEAPVATPAALRTPQRWPWIAGGALLLAAIAWWALTRDGASPPASDATTRVASNVASEVAKAADATAPAVPSPARPAPALRRPLVIAPPAARSTTRAIATTVANLPVVLRDATPANDTRGVTPDIVLPPPGAARAPAPPSPVARAAASPAYERITDLGNDDRKQLPPLKLSMHMWNDVVAQRFVIIDGTRLVVGDRLGAVVVADIVPDGVVLDWNGRALKLPLR